MLEVPMLIYLVICIINFIVDKARLIWFLAFIYFMLVIKIQDPINYFVLEYMVQSFLFIVFGFLFYENKLKMLICFALSLLSLTNLLCYLYPLEYPFITGTFILITDRVYFETLLLISCVFTNLKTTTVSFINIVFVSISYLV